MQTDFAVDQLTEAPTNWAEQTFQFTTDANTHRIAILFSAYAPGVNVSIQLDGISIEPQQACQGDIDNDSVGNGKDLDSDNDGIYDVTESGNSDLDTNGDGKIDSNDTGFVDANSNGAHDTVEGRTPTNTDTDTTVDMFDLDSDNDGCNDSSEAGYTDGDDDGKLGDSPVTQDSNGKVTSGVDGYTTPDDINNNNIKDYQEAAYSVGCLNPSITVTKTVQATDNDSDGEIGVGDTLMFTISILNSGETSLKDFVINDTFTDLQTNTLSFSTSITTTDPNELAPGQVKNYTVSYTLAASAVDNGGVVNSAVVTATDLNGLLTVSDTSDDGVIGAGDTGADPTVYSCLLYTSPSPRD